MAAPALPPFAAWRHRHARDGFEVVFLRATAGGHRFEGHSAAVEAGAAWAVEYAIETGPNWATRRARVVARTTAGVRELLLEGDGRGGWRVDGVPAPALQGCLDVDLEASAFTNALPVHRMGLRPGQAADAPAVYVRAADVAVERLGQRYTRVAGERYDYAAPRFGYAGRLEYDAAGLLLDYPGLAERAA